MKKFERALNVEDNTVLFPNVPLPRYASSKAAGADFCAAEDCIIPAGNEKPVLVRTGIKADMDDDDVLLLFNRSGNPKRGLVLANSVGVVDADYYSNPGNDGEIMFAFFNVSSTDVEIKAGDRIGQGVFPLFHKIDKS